MLVGEPDAPSTGPEPCAEAAQPLQVDVPSDDGRRVANERRDAVAFINAITPLEAIVYALNQRLSVV